MEKYGRLTLPVEVGAEEATKELISRLGADAIRNSDGTELPEGIGDLVDKVYSTRFVARGDNEWAKQNPRQRIHQYLMSHRVTAPSDEPLTIDPLATFYREQFTPDLDHDPHRYWEVINRTTGEVVDTDRWTVADDGSVTIANPQPFHEYTVTTLAYQHWDTTQMYNYITNDWQGVEKHIPFDVRYKESWARVKDQLRTWLDEHPNVSVVRFTTFFYHFTIAFGADGREKFVDWFGYSASVSPKALEDFAAEYGYRLRPEDIVAAGYHNSPFAPPTQAARDWIDFQHRFVTSRVAELSQIVHDAGREVMMFLGDNWMGVEPYGPHFKDTGIDAVVGSVGSAATTRMIADIPHLKYTEGRLLPYFFPDVFRPGGDPVGEARDCWMSTRRAIFRKPLDRIGYGGYLSLALKFPEFIEYTEQVVNEFREIHARSGSAPAEALPIRVAVVNQWGKMRTWMSEMVAHALWYKQTYTYLGVIESLAGLPLDVEFISFDDIADGALERVDVLINAGAYGTAWSGADAWADPALLATIRSWVSQGGAFIGVGFPSAFHREGQTFQLSDVLGVDHEYGHGLSEDKYLTEEPEHFIAADLPPTVDLGEGARDVYPRHSLKMVAAASGPGILPQAAQVVRGRSEVQIAVNTYGKGRAVYFSGLPYTPVNARALLRAVMWASHNENLECFWSSHPAVTVAHYPHTNVVAAANNLNEAVDTTITGPDGFSAEVHLEAGALTWLELV